MKAKSYEAMVIGHQIRYLRRVKDMSQKTLAQKIQVSVGWIGRIERGLYLPNLKLLFKGSTPISTYMYAKELAFH